MPTEYVPRFIDEFGAVLYWSGHGGITSLIECAARYPTARAAILAGEAAQESDERVHGWSVDAEAVKSPGHKNC